MSYKELSSLPAGSSGNVNEKSGPKGLPASAFGNATQPNALVITKKPTSIVVNRTGTYLFMYETTASMGTTATFTEGDGTNLFVSGATIQSANAGPIEMPIQPVAWGSSTALPGDVTFVYRGGL